MKNIILFHFLILLANSLIAQATLPNIISGDSSHVVVYHYSNGTLSGMSSIYYIKNAGGSGTIKVTVNAGAFTEDKQFTVLNNTDYKLVSDIPAKDSGYNTDVTIYTTFDPGISMSDKISATQSQGPPPLRLPVYHDHTPTGSPISTLIDLSPTTLVSNNLNSQCTLSQNYPNPFNKTTTILFSIPTKTFVSLKILDMSGSEITTLVSGILSAGEYSHQWNAEKITSGIYFYYFKTDSFFEIKKLDVLR